MLLEGLEFLRAGGIQMFPCLGVGIILAGNTKPRQAIFRFGIKVRNDFHQNIVGESIRTDMCSVEMQVRRV